ncbi:MAG: permease [Clostridia bacterium]|nr:permease [Clostridia bacterium]
MSGSLAVFTIILLGYAIGRISLGGIRLGASAVLLVALVAGHFGWTAPAGIRELGLACFVAAVGLMAGPVFIGNFKRHSTALICVSLLVVLSGVAICYALIATGVMSTALACGVFTGALTSTPGLAAAIEAMNDPLASVGYGIAYPFGVVGTVLFVQMAPRLFKADPLAVKTLPPPTEAEDDAKEEPWLKLDSLGLAAFALTAILGILLGKVQIPLFGVKVSLGVSGGPLFAGLFIGYYGRLGPVSLKTPAATLELMREVGLVLFLVSTGLEAGSGFVEVLRENGWQLFGWGALMTLVPLLLGFAAAYWLFKLDICTALGAMCGSMTSTPSLGTLLNMLSGNKQSVDAATVAYAGTYPVALIVIVIFMRLLSLIYLGQGG